VPICEDFPDILTINSVATFTVNDFCLGVLALIGLTGKARIGCSEDWDADQYGVMMWSVKRGNEKCEV
jgi:hypothetical protein